MPVVRPELPEIGPWVDRSVLLRFVGLTRRPCPTCTIEEHVAAVRRAHQIELEGEVEALDSALIAVLDGLGLSPEMWDRGAAIAVKELRRISAEQNR
jgi:hypothetical protein